MVVPNLPNTLDMQNVAHPPSVAPTMANVIEMLVAPVTDQLRLLLEPELMAVGLAPNELIAGLLAALTVTVNFIVLEPAELVAVSV